MASPLVRRLERSEQVRARPGSCLACALARMEGDVVECDGTQCHFGLANLLSTLGGDHAEHDATT